MSASPQSPDAAALSALGQIARGLLAQQGGELSWPVAKRGLREALLRDPLDSLAAIVLGGSYLFYLAEKGYNPKVESFWDALTFVTTSLSVGYDDVFARTPSGKAIASFVMTFGPTISGAALEPPAAEQAAAEAEKAAADAEALAVQKAILARLDAIHEALAQRAVPLPPADYSLAWPGRRGRKRGADPGSRASRDRLGQKGSTTLDPARIS